MGRVLDEFGRVARDGDPAAVHDLRTALRRCRTMAQSFRQLDPHSDWKKAIQPSRKLFQSLGELHDVQVARQWAIRLAPESDSFRQKLLEILAANEQAAKAGVEHALDRFDRKAWRKWSKSLPERARRVPREGLAFQHLAIERWNEAAELQQRAMRSRSAISWHNLRIAIKRFRYTIENFLPKRYDQWGAGLKGLQTLLGDVHDLDLLWKRLRKAGISTDPTARELWKSRLDAERKQRLAEYRRLATGPQSLWGQWRAALPQENRLEAAAIAKCSAWGSFLDSDFAHSQHVRDLALELFDGLRETGLNEVFRGVRERRIVECAALLHDIGRAKKDSGHHKVTYEMVRDLPPPLGWTAEDMLWTALVARYHRGSEPRGTHPGYGALSPVEQQRVSWLAAVMRLADSLDGEHNGRVLHVSVQTTREAIHVRAQGYREEMALTAEVAEKKHLLETLCGRPVIIRPAEIQPELMARSASA
jgi:CHAD domain-containing protein/HD superfamily phosphodiesterase